MSEILKLRKYAKVRTCLTQQLLAFFLNIFLFSFVKCKIIPLFFPSYERLWYIIIVNKPTFN